jgi:hypothetical protein
VWFQKPHSILNLRTDPGIRHPSRLWTDPCVFCRRDSRVAKVHLKCAVNHEQSAPQLLLVLNEATHVISAQLPRMDTAYELRQVFDSRRLAVMLLHDGLVKGAISSRIFRE